MTPKPDRTTPDVYFSAAYGRAEVASNKYNGWRLISHEDGRWSLPILLRKLPSGRQDAISPYGYSGIYCDESISNPDRLWHKTTQALKEMGVVSLFVRDSPLVPTYRPAEATAVVDDHPTYFLPNMAEDQAWKTLEGRARTSIRKALKSGLAVTLRTATMGDLTANSAFRQLYESTMNRVSADTDYLFPDSYFSQLAYGLGEDLYIAQAEKNEQIIASSLFMIGEAGVHYHLSGSTAEASKLGATNLILWEAWQLARRMSLPGLHLGGGVRKGDGLERFKRSFGGIQKSYSAYGIIIDEDQYDSEIRTAAEQLACPPDELTGYGFFPAYRAQAKTKKDGKVE